MILKIFPKAGHECTLEKVNNDDEGKPEQKFDAAFRIVFRINKCFQRTCSAQTVTRIGLLEEIPRSGVQIPCLS